MAKASLTFRFESRLERVTGPLGVTHLLPVPDDLAARWKKAGIRRLVGTIDGVPVNRGLQSDGDGGSYLAMGKPLLQETGLKHGSIARIELGPDPAPAEPAVPEELLVALAQDPEAQRRWDGFTPGQRRSLAYYVSTARQEPTRIKRAAELARKIGTYSLNSDRQAGPGRNPHDG